MITKVHHGTVVNGKFIPEDAKTFREAFYHFEGKPVEVIVRRKRKQRSDRQNRYYRGVIVRILADHLGYSEDEMHEALKWEFLRVHHDDKPDTVRSTTTLTTLEFEEYCEKVRMWASKEFGCFIPLPNEVDY
jgi:chloramphenicol 3-O-phosphotransferase